MAERVSWQYDAATEPWLRVLVLAGTSLLYGVQVLVAGGLLALLGLLLVAGSWELRLLVVVLALVGGPVSLLYLWPMLRDPDQRPAFFPAVVERRRSTRGKVALGAGTAALLVGAAWLDVRLAAGVVGVGLLAGVGYGLVATRGSLDPDTATLAAGQREFDLTGVVGYRTRRLGPLVVLRFVVPTRPGRFGGSPSWVRVPADRLEDVTRALDVVVAANAEREFEGRESNPAVRAVAVGLAVLFAAASVGGLVVGSSVGLYLAVVAGLLAVMFLLIAREG